MAAEKKAVKAGDKREKIDGVFVIFPADGGEPYYEETGEIYVKAEHEAIQLLTLGRVDSEKAWQEIKRLRPANPTILFWLPEIADPEDQSGIKRMLNPIRGLVLTVFEKPEILRRNDAIREDGVIRVKWCCFVLLTAPAWTRNRDKRMILAKPGTVVWVDMNQSFSADLRKKAKPTISGEGKVTKLHEIAIVPKGKVPIKLENGETGQSWRMDFYVVPRPEINAEQIAAIRVLIQLPAVPGEGDLEEEETKALPAGSSLPALPQSATPTTADPAAPASN